MLSDFYHQNEGDKIWWADDLEHIGFWIFSFDKKKLYYLFRDYPDKLTKEELEIFNQENPYWMSFFKHRFPEEIQKTIPDIPEEEPQSIDEMFREIEG